MVDFRTRAIREAPPSTDAVLKQIVETIVERLRPRRLILFGSRARGDAHEDSDYDVAVELEVYVGKRIDLEREIDGYFPDGKGWTLNVFLRRVGVIERNADDPGTVDWDIVREGKLLYAAQGVARELNPPATRQVRERPRKPPASVRRWRSRAQEDLVHAHRTAEMGDSWSFACFHAQQAAEKFLKALIVRQFERPKRTHDLKELLKAARAAGVALPGLDADCELLTPYAITTRYDKFDDSGEVIEGVEFDEAMGRAAVAAADRIAAAITPLLD